MGFPYYAVEVFSADHVVGRMGFRIIAVYAANRDGTGSWIQPESTGSCS